MVNVTYRGSLPELTGRRDDTISARTLRDVLRHIKTAYGNAAVKAAKAMLITVNGKSCLRLAVFDTVLAEGDAVSFLPISAGG